MKAIIAVLVAFVIGASLSGCSGRSVLTADLSSDKAFEEIVGQEMLLLSGTKAWLLMRDLYDPVTNYSDGYKLFLVDAEKAARIVSGRYDPPSTPKGFYEVLGIVDGSTIRVEKVHEYGMETAVPVALGVIVVNSGRRYQFETEWHPFFKSQLTRR